MLFLLKKTTNVSKKNYWLTLGEKKENVNNAPQNVVKKKTSIDITLISQEIVEILSKGVLSPDQLKLSLSQYSIDQIAAAIELLEEKSD